ncbi:YbaN family protein [Pseudohalioglobus lutimaris]|uniref:YbaN family protein n=1 Tax=Pseudohalioglobus lutimaris TaxID=1737061 RepID=UPI00096B93EC|nr:YbaN family protein [Pseudohalioglobus lutimaris]
MRRSLYKPLGVTFLALGAAGIVLPVLPTTPFVLLAAWFFARSSEQWHQRLLDSELFGPMIHNWEERRCVSLRAKCVGIGSMAAAGTASIVFALSNPWARAGTALLMLIGALVLGSIKTCPATTCACEEDATENDSPE